MTRWRADVVAFASYLGAATYLLSGMWSDIDGRYLQNSGQDQALWEWFYSFTSHAVTHGHNPLFTSLQNYPAGVNLMANTSTLGLGIPLIPVTNLFSATTTFVLVLTIGLSTTAAAWYWLFSRELVASRLAAWIGGAVCGFSPAMISHASAHPNLVVGGLLPMVAGFLIRFSRNDIRRFDWVFLGAIAALQMLIGEEPFLIFAMAICVFGVVYLSGGLRQAVAVMWRPVVLAGCLCLVLVGPLIAFQFFGPQSYWSIANHAAHNDFLSLATYSPHTMGGDSPLGSPGSINRTENNSHFGVGLLLLIAAATMWLRHKRVIVAAAATAATFAALSLGVGLHHLPLVGNIVESRLTLATWPVIAVIVAFGCDQLRFRSAAVRIAAIGATAVALLPLLPYRLATVPRLAPPDFFASNAVGDWVDDGSVLLVPPTRPQEARGLVWQAAAGFTFPLVGGHFLGPHSIAPPDNRVGRYGAEPRPTTRLLTRIADTGVVPRIGDRERLELLNDLQFWRVDAVVLPDTKNGPALFGAVNDLLQFPPRIVDDVWVWDVRRQIRSAR